jgi:hypothetical protein
MKHVTPGMLIVIILLSYLALASTAELRLAVPLLIGVTAAMAIALSCIFLLGERGRMRLSPAIILGVAFALRMMFVCSQPQLSDDIYRYLWDGGNLLQGINPYAAAPETIIPPPELQTLQTQINHPQYVTIYPPAAQLIFAAGAAAGGTVTGLKAFLVLIDMGLCTLIVLLLKRLELPAWRGVLYAWNPLAVVEIAGSGHVDGAGMALLLGAFCLLIPKTGNDAQQNSQRWRFLFAGVLLACAGLVKLFPLALAPLLYLQVPRAERKLFVVGFFGALGLLILAFMPQLTNMLGSLDAYARNWEFAGFAFTALRSLTGSGSTARIMLVGLFLITAATIFFRLARQIRCDTSPTISGHLTLQACYAIALTFLLCTPTLQPWYALSLAAFLPFYAGPAGLVFCWVVFLTYQVQIPYFILGKWLEDPTVTAAVFLAPILAYALSKIFSARTATP